MKKILVLITFLVSATFAMSQNPANKIVYDLSSGDTAVQATVLRQMTNILKAAPGTQLEVVCHGQGIFLLVEGKTFFKAGIEAFKENKNISFKVCANSLKRFNVDKSNVISQAGIVPVAILELSGKQMEGWSYIKAGY
jgi:intracellular sulfur oxidation DsrE/DsrF family protein